VTDFRLTPKQDAANKLLASPARNILLYGGSRSGKTFLEVRGIGVRAVKAPGSRHCILRFRQNAVKRAIVRDTFPAVMRSCFPGMPYRMYEQDGFAELKNESQIWFGGLDDKERTEKILGNEYATLLFNECSQIPFAAREIAMTRLAQKCEIYDDGVATGKYLSLKAYYDENPPGRGHWTYRLFFQKVSPDTKIPVPDPSNYVAMQMNPEDNRENLPVEYFGILNSMTERMKTRFLRGEFRDDSDNALFPEHYIDQWRCVDGRPLPDMVRIVIAVDPSGSGDVDNADNDAIGIVVAGLGTDGNAYVMEDLTVKAGPGTWGKVATDAFDRHQADLIVGEVNYGGAMVKHVIQTARQRTPYREVTASRGKVVRAEPISALVEKGKVRFAGYFPELEEELAGFTATAGYQGDNSPNRADAFVWAMSELFPGVVNPRKAKVESDEEKAIRVARLMGHTGSRSGAWMR